MIVAVASGRARAGCLGCRRASVASTNCRRCARRNSTRCRGAQCRTAGSCRLLGGRAVDSDASSAPLTNGTGVAGMNSVAVGSSAAASVGSSRSWLASPDCSASGSNPGSKKESPDAPEEPLNPSSGAYGPAAKFVTLGESSSNSPSVTNMTARHVLTIIPMRMRGRTTRSPFEAADRIQCDARLP